MSPATALPESDYMSEIGREIGVLTDLPRSDLVERWRTLYRCAPPKCISRRMLVGAIAYAMQAKSRLRTRGFAIRLEAKGGRKGYRLAQAEA